MKAATEYIREIIPIESNFNHIAKHGKINGSLLLDIEKAMEAYARQGVESSNKETKEFLQTLLDANMCSHAADDLIKEYIKGLEGTP